MRRVIICAMLLCVCVLSACGGSDESPAPSVTTITAAEAKDMMDSGEPFVLLDVRTASEYAERRIYGAILIPDTEISERTGIELPDKSARILVYCHSGRRSASAAGRLARMGYTNVYDFGGIIDWPFETVSG